MNVIYREYLKQASNHWIVLEKVPRVLISLILA